MSAEQRWLSRLADGRPRSAAVLAEGSGLTAEAVRRRVDRLRRAGWPIRGLRGRGFVLDPCARPLDPDRLRGGLDDQWSRIAELAIEPHGDSSQTWLDGRTVPRDGRAVVCVLDRQAAGRGRRGTAWVAPPGGAITFSIARRLRTDRSALGCLSITLALAVARALCDAGVDRVAVKWPNDVLIDGAKVAGLLVETRPGPDRAATALVGIGLNHDLGDRALAFTATDVCRHLAKPPSRSALTAALVASVVGALERFDFDGPAADLAAWPRYDALAGEPVGVDVDGATIQGIAAGIDPTGALLIDTPAGRRRTSTGHVRRTGRG